MRKSIFIMKIKMKENWCKENSKMLSRKNGNRIYFSLLFKAQKIKM